MAKYYNARVRRNRIILYRKNGTRKVEKRIGPRSFAWYFCVGKKDLVKNVSLFKELKNDGYIENITVDDNPDYYRIYCDNQNIYHKNTEDSDAKRMILSSLKAAKIETYEADVSSAVRYMIDTGVELEDNHYVGYFDIETRDDEELEVGAHQILSIAIVDDEGNEWCYCSRNERKLLYAALKKLSEFTVLCGWNSKAFDWEYIKRRCRTLDVPFDLYDINHIDLMLWFEKALTAGSIKERPRGMKLDSVAQQYLGMKKTEGVMAGHGRIWKLFNEDPKSLKEYNLQDCRLLYHFDRKMQAITQLTMQSRITGCPVGRITPSSLTDYFLLHLAKKNHVRLPTKNEKPRSVPKATGGRVWLREPGARDYLLAFDFKGYYNSIMRQFNIGPDTRYTFAELKKVPQEERGFPLIISPFTWLSSQFIRQLYDLMIADGHPVTWEEFAVINFKESKLPRISIPTELADEFLESYIEELYKTVSKKFTFSYDHFRYYFFHTRSAGSKMVIKPRFPVWFRRDKKSIVAQALDVYTDERNRWKKKREQLIEDGYDEDSTEVKNADQYINVYKLLGNIVFGQQGNQYSRIFHQAACNSITMTAQPITMMTKKWFEQNGVTVIYMDTDSNYVILRSGFRKSKLRILLNKFKNEYPKYLKRRLCKLFNLDPNDKWVIELEFEKIWRRMILLAKKHYAGLCVWEAGKGKTDSLDIKGIEIKRRGTTDFTKEAQENLLDFLLRPKELPSGADAYQWVKDLREKLAAADRDEELVRSLVKRVVMKKHPKDYKNNAPQKRILERIFARGDHFELGSILQYVVIESPVNKTEGEEVEYFLANRDKMKIDYSHYWDKEVYDPCHRILSILYPGQNWSLLYNDTAVKVKKKFAAIWKRCQKKYKKNAEEQWRKAVLFTREHQTIDLPAKAYLYELIIERCPVNSVVNEARAELDKLPGGLHFDKEYMELC